MMLPGASQDEFSLWNSSSHQGGRGFGRFVRRLLSLSPGRMVVVMAVLIFTAELSSHLFIQANLLPSQSPYRTALLDSTILLVILSPAYFGFYRPFWLERQRSEEEVRRLSWQLIHTEEETRAKLVRDLHDEFGQGLTSLQFGLETLRSSLTEQQQKESALCVRLSGLVAQVGTNVRNIMTELRPSVLETLGLVEALRWSVRHFSEKFSDIRVDLQLDDGGRLLPEIEISLYRVCQEALNNVAKHAMARQVRIRLVRTLTTLTLTIADDGKGFAALPDHDSATDAQGYGILGMRERIAGVGGDFSVLSAPSKGTTVWVQLPLSKEV